MKPATLIKLIAIAGMTTAMGCSNNSVVAQSQPQPVTYVYNYETADNDAQPEPQPLPPMPQIQTEQADDAAAQEVPPMPEIAAEEAPAVAAFEEDLAPQGQWVVVAEYGRCWVPAGVTPAWRPYTVGYWAYTDYGWTWVSEERWGGITYHYGRWVVVPRHGWVWVPGTVWAPAWVAWRTGDGYIGWAPLPPTPGFRARVAVTAVEIDRIAPANFCFVREREITERHMHQHVVPVRENVTIVKKTVNITKIEVVNKTVVNRSLTMDRVEKATGKRIDRVQVREVNDRRDVEEAHKRGEVVAYHPKPVRPVAKDAKPEPRPTAHDANAPTRDGNPRPPVNATHKEPLRVVPLPPRHPDAEKIRPLGAKQQETNRTKAAEVKREEKPQAKAAEVKRNEPDRTRAAEAKRPEPDRAKAPEARRPEPDRAKAPEAKHPETPRTPPAEVKREQPERAKADEPRRAGNDNNTPDRNAPERANRNTR